jgi:hypothetical protein
LYAHVTKLPTPNRRPQRLGLLKFFSPAILILLRIRNVPVSHLGPETGYPEGFRGLPQCIHANAGRVPSIKLPSISLGAQGEVKRAPWGLYSLTFPWWALLPQTRTWWTGIEGKTLASGTEEILYKHWHAWSRSKVAAPLPG